LENGPRSFLTKNVENRRKRERDRERERERKRGGERVFRVRIENKREQRSEREIGIVKR
jgi:hypothetical protein